jgi:hypothetical protein
MISEGIDIVYTWVDGNDPAHFQQVKKYGSHKKHLNPERYRDLFEMLKYSLRSVEQYAPWIRNIHLVTARPHVPSWLDVTHDRVYVHHHDELIPSEYLPTFSSRTIESFLHKIPDVSDTFIYLNDDFLFGSPIDFFDLFHQDGRSKVFGTITGKSTGVIRDDIYYHFMSRYQHLPRVMNKKIYSEMEEAWKNELHETRSNRFRVKGNVLPHMLYAHYALTEHSDKTYAPRFREFFRLYKFHKIMNSPAKQRRKLEKLIKADWKFICMNDDQREHPNQKVVSIVRAFLEQKYPIKSKVEL